MSNSVSESFEIVRNLVNEYKFEEALQKVQDIEQNQDIRMSEYLQTLNYKSRIYIGLGQIKIALKIAEELLQKSKELNMPLFSLDAFALKASILYNNGTPKEDFYTNLKEFDNLFTSLPTEETSEFQEREAHLLTWKGARHFNRGDLNRSLDYYSKSLSILEKIDPRSYLISVNLMGMAYAYGIKGELNHALQYTEKALSLLPEGENYLTGILKAAFYRNLGGIYHQQGDLDIAVEYFRKDLEIPPQKPYQFIIQALLAKNDIVQARKYLEEFKQFVKSPETDLSYQGAHALILKTSPRLLDHFEAATILKKIFEEFHQDPSIISNIFSQNILLASLCELYLEEFRLSNQMEALDDVSPLIDLLQKNAKLQNSYSSLANVKLLQAKLAILKVNLVDARKLLTEAQQIASEHDLQLLASEISQEHDHLLEELKLWDSFKKTQTSVADRLKLASIDSVMERLQGKSEVEAPEISVEEPILLLIMNKSGVSYFNHSFIGDWDYDDLFSSFMSAFNDFSGEIFSRSIDRIKSGEYTILINPIEPFLACYIIKGQSYPAQQKLARFSDSVKSISEIWDALTKSLNTGEMLQLDDPPSLGSCVNEIFAI
ncbi:MAG: tetratricopeptide repeat protein [Promethearchaeota archaeon]